MSVSVDDRRAKTSDKMILGKVLLLAVAAVGVSVATPPPGHVASTPDNDKTGPKYDYGYDVNDGDGGRQGHVESRDGVHAQGSYYVQLPHSDQQVRYSADDWGYHPLVTYGSRTHNAVTNTHFALGSEAVAALASLRKTASSPTPTEGHPKTPTPGRLVITELHPSPSPLNASPPQDTVNTIASSTLHSGHAQRLTASIALDGNLPHVDVVPGRVRYLVKSLDNEVADDTDASQKATINDAQALPLTQAQPDAGDAIFGNKLAAVSNSIAEAVTLRPIVVAELGDDNAVTAAPAAFTTASPIYDHSSTAIFTTARPILARPTTPAYASSTPSFEATPGHVDVGEYGVPTATPATVVITPRPNFSVDVDGDDAGHQVAMQFVKERFKASTIVEVQRAVPVEFEHAPSRDAEDSNGIPIEYLQKVVDATEGFGQKTELHSGVRDRQPQRVYPVYSQTLHDGGEQQAEQQVEQHVLNAQLVQQFQQQQAEQQVLNQQQAEQQVINQQQAEQQVFNQQQAEQQVFIQQQAEQQVFTQQQAEQQVFTQQQAEQQVFTQQQAEQQVFNQQQAEQQVFNQQQAEQQVFDQQQVEQQTNNNQQIHQQIYNDQEAQQQVYNDQKVQQQVFADQQAQQQVLAEQQAQQQAYSDAIEQQALKEQQAEQQVHGGQQLVQQVFTNHRVELQVLQKTPQQVSVGHKDSTEIIGLLPPISDQPSNPAPQYEQHVAAEIAKLKQSHAFLVANQQVQEIAASRPSYVPVGDAQLVQANHERALYRNQLLQAHSANQLLRQEHATLVAQQQPDPTPLATQGTEELRLHDQFVAGNQHLLRGEQVQQQFAINVAALEASHLQAVEAPKVQEAGLEVDQQLLVPDVRTDADRLQQQATAGAVSAQAGVATSLLKAENSVATPLSAAYTAQLQANAIRRPTSAALHQQAVNTAHQSTLRFKTQAQTDKQADAENDYNQQLVEESKQDEIAPVKAQPLADVTRLRTLLRAEQAPGGIDVVGLTPPVQDAVQGPVHTIQVPVTIYQQPAIKQAVRLQFAQPSQMFPQFYQQAVVPQQRFPHVKVANRPHPAPLEVTKLVAVDRPWSYPLATGVPVNHHFRHNTAPTPLKLVRAHAGFHGAPVPRNPRFQTAAAHAYRGPPTRFGGHPKLADFHPSQPEFFKPGRGVDHQELHRLHGRTKKLNIEYGFKPPLIPSLQIPVDDPQPEPEPVND